MIKGSKFPISLPFILIFYFMDMKNQQIQSARVEAVVYLAFAFIILRFLMHALFLYSKSTSQLKRLHTCGLLKQCRPSTASSLHPRQVYRDGPRHSSLLPHRSSAPHPLLHRPASSGTSRFSQLQLPSSTMLRYSFPFQESNSNATRIS